MSPPTSPNDPEHTTNPPKGQTLSSPSTTTLLANPLGLVTFRQDIVETREIQFHGFGKKAIHSPRGLIFVSVYFPFLQIPTLPLFVCVSVCCLRSFPAQALSLLFSLSFCRYSRNSPWHVFSFTVIWRAGVSNVTPHSGQSLYLQTRLTGSVMTQRQHYTNLLWARQ